MASICGAIAVSHTPTIGFAVDHDKDEDPVWKPIFEAFDPVRAWLDRAAPDVLFVIYNDHISSFFLDHYSPFALGVGASYEPADEGGGPRDLPSIGGDSELARHIARSLSADEFDISLFQDKPLDHGCFSPLSMIYRRDRAWPVPIVPLQVGVLQLPAPTARRCFKLGAALRRAIESYPKDIKVAIVGTGGLSHQVHGERAGFNNETWDADFLDLIENDPERIAQLTQAELATLGGMEGAEVVMWLIMRGALSANVRKVHQAYYLPSMTGIATVVYENRASQPIAGEIDRHRSRVHEQLTGVERLEGTYPYTLERSVGAYRLNRFLHRLTQPSFRNQFRADEVATLGSSDLTETERALVQSRDWRGLIHYGVIFFLLEKLGAVVGVSNLHIYAAMRGQALEEFQKTRRAPNAVYSVAGRDAKVGSDK
jgi:gallate dioxygenase